MIGTAAMAIKHRYSTPLGLKFPAFQTSMGKALVNMMQPHFMIDRALPTIETLSVPSAVEPLEANEWTERFDYLGCFVSLSGLVGDGRW